MGNASTQRLKGEERHEVERKRTAEQDGGRINIIDYYEICAL